MKPVILCVDDESIVLQSLEVELFEYFGQEFFFEFAETGEEALEIVDELLQEGIEIPVVISDYVMPRLKGDQLLAQVHERSPDTKNILLTGEANIHGVTNAINHANLYRYIAKPWERKDFILTIKEAIKVYYQSKLVAEQNEELKSLNSNLEEKVQERTKALEEQKEAVVQALDQLKNTQSQLIQSERMASLWQLTAGLAHELNNPLNFVLTGTEALAEGLGDLGQLLAQYSELDAGNIHDIEQFITQIKRSKDAIAYKDTVEELQILLKTITVGALRSSRIVKGLKIFSGLDKFDVSFIDLNVNMDLTLLMLEHRYKERIKVHKQYTNKLHFAEAYLGQINQLLLNVLTNAIDAIEGEGAIYIETNQFEEEGMIYVEAKVRDTGKGMDQATKEKAFEPFFTTKDVGQGTGLGLSIAYGVVETHRGKIKIASQEGEGTEITIQLPTKQLN